jgi:hypothetical protein
MISLISVASLLSGGALAYAGQRFPRRTAMFETYGGVLLIGGLALLGAALPRL